MLRHSCHTVIPLSVLILVGSILPSPTRAQEGKAPAAEESTTEAAVAAAEPGAEAQGVEGQGVEAQDVEAQDEVNIYDRCGDNPKAKAWLDRVGYGVYRSVCASATWVDSFFGGERDERERDKSYGRLGVGFSWNDFDGTSAQLRLRAKVQFPRFQHRVNAFVGRYEKDDFVRGQNDDVGSVPALFQEAEEKDWLLGLGYNPVRSVRSRLDFDGGVRLDFPVDPFVKGTYRYYLVMDERNLIRMAQTVFWTNQLDFGTTTRLDAERALGSNLLLRWQGLGTVAQKTEGLEWRSSVTLYEHFGGLRAIAWKAEIEGKTDAPVNLDFYGLRAIYRQRIFRDDLFLELQGRVFWPKSIDEPERKATPGIGFGFEMLWGEQPLSSAKGKGKKTHKGKG